MRAIMLAAGVGRRLGEHGDAPKCLLEFGHRSLLDRHISNLARHKVVDITVCVGYRRELVAAHLKRAGHPNVHLITNPAYRDGSIVSLWATREILRSGADILLMDADVLYVETIMDVLMKTPPANRFLCDRDFEAGDEPVKICLDNGRIVEFRKRIAPSLAYNDCGESVGFFTLTADMAARLADVTETYVAGDRRDEPYEEAIRDLALSCPQEFEVADVSGMPWIEIDFPQDIARANEAILPHIHDN